MEPVAKTRWSHLPWLLWGAAILTMAIADFVTEPLPPAKAPVSAASNATGHR